MRSITAHSAWARRYPNVVYWSYTGGCKRKLQVGDVTVRPCPPHAICSWLVSPNYNVPFCPFDPAYAAPGVEDALLPDNGADLPSDGLPPQGSTMGGPVLPGMSMIGSSSASGGK